MFIGNGRGKVGNLVLSSVKGQQITRAYQPVVKNPKSYGQMYQRAKFANAIKFYTRAMNTFFSFAFEDKKQNESDYNAFMRHNIRYSIPLQKPAYNAQGYPALGNNWMLSQGSLNIRMSLSYDYDEGAFYLSLPAVAEISERPTIGELSKRFIQAGCEEGDIVTIVAINKSITQEYLRDLLVERKEDEWAPQWTVAQFFVSSTSTQLLTAIATKGYYTVADGFAIENQSEGLRIGIPMDDYDSSWDGLYGCQWCGVVVTRKTSDGGLKATNTFLTPNSDAQHIETLMSGNDEIAAAVQTWQNDVNSVEQPTEVILKGGVADGLSSGSTVTGTESQADGVVSSVNGGESLPVKLSTPVVGKAVNIRIQGINLDKVVFDGVNATIDAIALNTLNTEAVLTYTPKDSDVDIEITANKSVIAAYYVPTFTSVNGQTLSSADDQANLQLTNSEVLTVTIKGKNLTNYSASSVTTSGDIKKSGSTTVSSDGGTITLGITAKSGAVDGSTGTISVGGHRVANVTVNIHAVIDTITIDGVATAVPGTVKIANIGDGRFELKGDELSLLDKSKFASSNSEITVTMVTTVSSDNGTQYFLQTSTPSTLNNDAVISYDGTTILTVQKTPEETV